MCELYCRDLVVKVVPVTDGEYTDLSAVNSQNSMAAICVIGLYLLYTIPTAFILPCSLSVAAVT